MKNKSGKIVAVAVLGLAGILCIALLTAGYLKKTSEAKRYPKISRLAGRGFTGFG